MTNTYENLEGFAVIDFETTGLNPKLHDRAIQLAIVRTTWDAEITSTWSHYINPHRKVAAEHIHHITDDMLIHAPSFPHIVEAIEHRLENKVIVAHNLPFDAEFMDVEMSRAGHNWHTETKPCLDTKEIAPLFIKGLESYSLANCLKAANIDVSEGGRGFAHDAEADAVATSKLLKYFLNIDKSLVYEQIKNV